MALPIGPEVDATPRPVPSRAVVSGQYVVLEPLHERHVDELWPAAQGADESWTYLPYGPFATKEALLRQVRDAAADASRVTWTVRQIETGVASGWLSLMDIQPRNAAIELGGIWLSPVMQRTRAATEAMFLPLKLAADDLGYRRLVWKCNSLNAPSKRAAERLGFTFEGTHRMHMVAKGRRRDSDWYSIIEDEWPSRRDALLAWLEKDNFGPDGVAKRRLEEIRAHLLSAP
jgi:RimJ/RimL family protein N-acetyltransferase